MTRRDVPVPSPGPGELLVRVLACGVCRTDLHVAEGDLPAHRPGVVPGHEVGGVVERPAGRFAEGDLVGIPWLRWTCGTCRFCVRGMENLCPDSRYTGWDADGGYAEYATVSADYALPLPSGYSHSELAPLLCAGIIGYHALLRAEVPRGGRLGVYGFGGSAHLAAQVALAQGATVHVVTRNPAAQALALSLGAASASATEPPEPLDSAIIFAPAGTLVPRALAALDRGGTVVIAGIHLRGHLRTGQDMPHRHERRVRDMRHALKGAFGSLSDLNAPFETSRMTRTRLSRRRGNARTTTCPPG